MDELELLKKDWQKQEDTLPELSYDQLYKMHLKKSSSIVKWIFIISVLEFVFWPLLDFVLRISGLKGESKGEWYDNLITAVGFVAYGVMLYFAIQFFLNYKRIKTTDSSKVLMKNILKTRKTVKQYVWTNVIFFVLVSVILIGHMVFYEPNLAGHELSVKLLILVVFVFCIAVFVAGIVLFYRLVYGILIRKLQKNYEELEKIEI